MKKTAATFDDAKEMLYEIMDAADGFEPWGMHVEGHFNESALPGVWILSFEVSGDWKHDHWAFDEQVEELYPFLLNKGERVVEENGSDWYTAIHDFAFAGKNVDLNAMSKLFASNQGGKAMKKRAKGDFCEECVEELHDGQYTAYINEFWYDGFPFPFYQYDIECPDGTWVYANDEYESIRECEDRAYAEIAEIKNETMMRTMLGSKKIAQQYEIMQVINDAVRDLINEGWSFAPDMERLWGGNRHGVGITDADFTDDSGFTWHHELSKDDENMKPIWLERDNEFGYVTLFRDKGTHKLDYLPEDEYIYAVCFVHGEKVYDESTYGTPHYMMGSGKVDFIEQFNVDAGSGVVRFNPDFDKWMGKTYWRDASKMAMRKTAQEYEIITAFSRAVEKYIKEGWELAPDLRVNFYKLVQNTDIALALTFGSGLSDYENAINSGALFEFYTDVTPIRLVRGDEQILVCVLEGYYYEWSTRERSYINEETPYAIVAIPIEGGTYSEDFDYDNIEVIEQLNVDGKYEFDRNWRESRTKTAGYYEDDGYTKWEIAREFGAIQVPRHCGSHSFVVVGDNVIEAWGQDKAVFGYADTQDWVVELHADDGKWHAYAFETTNWTYEPATWDYPGSVDFEYDIEEIYVGDSFEDALESVAYL